MQSTGLIGNNKFTTTAGVKQGGSSSCNQFTAYIDPTIDAVNAFGPDDWLNNLHILRLMDDTVIFATSRGNLHAKLHLLKNCTDEIGMILHPTKNCTDEIGMILHPTKSLYLTVNKKYTYLGAIRPYQPKLKITSAVNHPMSENSTRF